MMEELEHNKKIFRAGSYLITQGQPARYAYLILQGKVFVYQEHQNSKTELGEVGAGEIVGEMALLTGGGEHSATVEILEDVHVIEIDSSTLDDIYLKSNPVLKMAIS